MRAEKDAVERSTPERPLDRARSVVAPQPLAGVAGAPDVTWRMLRVLGFGGMARVSLAEQWRDGKLERLVAIKRMHEHLAENEEFVRMFFDESRLASAIQHPNVVRVLDVYAREGERFLVLEYVEGYSLARIMQHFHGEGRRVPLSFALRVVIDTLRGLHAAHEARDGGGRPLGIIHRDVAPQNVLVSTGGVARITDFGVARAVGRLSVTAPGLVKGHLAYVAPEAVSGGDVTHRADIFAAGVILWEVLSGQRLMAADSPVETLRKVTIGRIPPPVDAAPLLATVCARALERDPARRYPTAHAFALALEEAATHLGVSLLRGNATALIREIDAAERAKEGPAPSSYDEARLESRASSPPPPNQSGRYARTLQPVRLAPREAEAETDELAAEDPTLAFTSSPVPVEDGPTLAEPRTFSPRGPSSIEIEMEPEAEEAPLERLQRRRQAILTYLVGLFALVGFGYTLWMAFALARWALSR